MQQIYISGRSVSSNSRSVYESLFNGYVVANRKTGIHLIEHERRIRVGISEAIVALVPEASKEIPADGNL
jgi:hypothetical protein